MKPICANVFIASTKGNEAYSSDCRRVIEAVADGEFYLIEPSICLTEVIRNISKYLGIEAERLRKITSDRWFPYGKYAMTIFAPAPDIRVQYTELMQWIPFILKQR